MDLFLKTQKSDFLLKKSTSIKEKTFQSINLCFFRIYFARMGRVIKFKRGSQPDIMQGLASNYNSAMITIFQLVVFVKESL
jgi:hypothetical protein